MNSSTAILSSGGRSAPARGIAGSRAESTATAKVGPDHVNNYDSFVTDILGDEVGSDDEDDKKKKKRGGYGSDEDDEENSKYPPFMFFDFRKGPDAWPTNVEMVDPKRAEELLEKATKAAEEAAKLKKKEGEDHGEGGKGVGSGTGTSSVSYSGIGSHSSNDDDDGDRFKLHPDAQFETLKDGSTALLVKPGYRLRLRLNELLEGGDEQKAEREKSAARARKRTEEFWGKSGAEGPVSKADFWSDDMFQGKKWFKEYVNEYTITMDVKLLEEVPRDGIALFQTGLIHCSENKRSGKTSMSRSEGECIVNQAGGLGMFGTYGDTTKARLEVGAWKRVVVAVKCVESANNAKGEFRTWVGTEAGVVLKEESIVANERFALDPDNLYIFSSALASMMPGGMAIRTIRVEHTFASDRDVRQNRARDKLLSVFDEERKKEVEEQRKGLSLASLFVKPRPMWMAPPFVGIFGDAFIENSTLEGTSNLAWSYTVLNYAMQRMVKNPLLMDDAFGLQYQTRVGLSDVLHVMQQSAAVFKLMMRMLKTPTESQLLSFLRKVKKYISGITVGETLMLPAIVQGKEMIIILERTTERTFKVVVVQTDAQGGLRHHSVSPIVNMPEIHYRTCMIFQSVPKKNVLDDVFWMGLYNLTIHSHDGDIDKFYDVLLPFLTSKPLEVSLVEAETAAVAAEESRVPTVGVKSTAAEESKEPKEESAPTATAAATSGTTKKSIDYGEWRSPQRSDTAYVQCTLEAFRYLLRCRAVSDLQADQILLCLRSELVEMMKNDLSFMLPDENGVRVCSLAIKELSHFAVEVVNEVKSLQSKSAPDSAVASVNTELILEEVYKSVTSSEEVLAFCKNDEAELPPVLDLAGVENAEDPNDPALTQFMDHPVWDVINTESDPGQAVALQKYIPIDLLMIPKKANTREEAITAIRMCDRMCYLIENQSHCVKNRKFLIVSVIEHVFTQVVPVPKPRGVGLTAEDLYRASRSSRRNDKKEEEAKAAAEEKKRKQLEKGIVPPASKVKGAVAAVVIPPPKVQCIGEEVQPDFDVGKAIEQQATDEFCIWDQPINYELQVELQLSLQRVAEHFVAATMSIVQSRPFDAVCIIVSGCLTALSDALMRKIAVDEPSSMCAQLMGKAIDGRQLGHPGFGVSVGTFASQSETLEVHTPELCIARTAVLDYFQSPAQRKLEKIFAWEEDFVLKPGRNLIKYLRMVSKEVGLPIFKPHFYLLDSNPISSNLIKNFPEFKCYRDIAFIWKFFLNTDRTVFKNYVAREGAEVANIDRMDAQLSFEWDEQAGGYNVSCFGDYIKCRPNPNQNDPITGRVIPPDQLPTHRYPSTATPSFYVPSPLIRTEDDAIYRPNLPSFEDEYGQVLNQRDSELLISYLTVPYMRVPLLLSFFASDDRIHKLQSPELRLILDSVLFEPGKYLRMDMTNVEPMMVPTPHPDLLASPYGLLLNELGRSPDTVIRSVLALLKGALACDTGSVVDDAALTFNVSTTIIIYCARMGARVDNYLSFLIEYAAGTHDCIDWPLRECDVSDEILTKLKDGRVALREFLEGQFHTLFEDYLKRLDYEISSDPTNEILIDRNSRLACDLHAHLMLMYRNYKDAEITTKVARTLLGSFVYLTTRHTWNKVLKEGKALQFPEVELYSVLQVQRRRVIHWLARQKQRELDEVMQTVLQVSSSLTGSFKANAEVLDSQNRWSRIQGERSVGRWAVGSTRNVGAMTAEDSDMGDKKPSDVNLLSRLTIARETSALNDPGMVVDNGMLGVEIDVQLGQMTLRSKHLAALSTEIANHPDVRSIFGDSTMQASMIELSEHRQVYRLVGLNHELHYWRTSHNVCPPLGDEWEREYDPAELFETEKWISQLFEPIRKSFFDGPQPPPMQFMMTEKATPADAEVAVMLGLHQFIGGPWKLIYLFRRLKCVHIYECVTQGREWFYTLHLTTDCRYTLREMQPSSQNRNYQYPDWWVRGSGAPYPASVRDYLMNDITGTSAYPNTSVLVVREQQHHLNISGGKEVLVPSRLLYGAIPHALLDAYRFWQDESIAPRGTLAENLAEASRGYKRLLGYPIEEDAEYMIVVEFGSVGSWTENNFTLNATKNHPFLLQSTGFPGRSVRITRRPKAAMAGDFEQRQRLASVLDSLMLLVPPAPKKKDKGDVEEERGAGERFKVDAAVECNYEGKDEYWPCVVRRVNDDGTYDLEYVNDYKWLGVQRNVDPEIIQKRGEGEKKKRGEGVWHWDGMSDSEEDAWREDSEDEAADNSDDVEKNKKQRLIFNQFDELHVVLNAAGGDEDACIDAFHQIVAETSPPPQFHKISELASAVRDVMKRNKQGMSFFNQDEDDADSGAIIAPAAAPAEEEDMVMLNLLYAPRRSRLHSILKVLARIENASHICAWTKISNLRKGNRAEGLEYGCPPIDLVECPRLKLAFTTREDHNGVLRMYSVDHVDLFIANPETSNSEMTVKMLAGIPHSIIMSNVRGETQVLVPVLTPTRPRIMAEPFSTFIVLDRTKIPLAERFFLYPVHISFSFLLTKGLNSALYLMLLRFLNRTYPDVFRLADSIATDTKLNAEGLVIYKAFKSVTDDWHPDAHSCRLKISLVTIDSGMEAPWDLTIECARHTVKLDSVSSSCRMAVEEELQLLESSMVVTKSSHSKYNKDLHDHYSMALCHNRKHLLRAQIRKLAGSELSEEDVKNGVKVHVRAPPRAMITNWPFYQDNTVFGENYMNMKEVTAAEGGEESWATQVLGGDQTDAPEGGWLIVAVFHTLWSAGCIKIMPSLTELVPMYQDMLNFVSVKADSQGMVKVSKSLKIVKFPTILVMRGGKEVERLTGHERVVERLIRSLNNHITNEDKIAHAKHRHRVRIEKALEMGIDVSAMEEEEEEERGQLDWTFDPEQCGESMQIEHNGMLMVLSEEQDKDDEAQWEFTTDHRRANKKWLPFPPKANHMIEKFYSDGDLYNDGEFSGEGFEVYCNDVTIDDYEVSGFSGYDSQYNDIAVRRCGDRKSVPGEEAFITKEQKEKDKRAAEWRGKYEAYKRKLKEQRIGKDVEAMRGTIGFLPNTGVHCWTFRWNHEPGRQGRSDGFGVCGDGREEFTSGPAPALGGTTDSGASLALYADGSLLHNGKLLYTAKGQRIALDTDSEKATETSTETATAAVVEEKKEEATSDSSPAAEGIKAETPAEVTVDGEQQEKKKKKFTLADLPIKPKASLFGRRSLVRCDLDTGLDGGTLTFSIDGKPLEDIVLKDMYSMLGASEIFPCLCVCPLDPLTEAEAKLKKKQQDDEKKKRKKKKKGKQEAEKEDSGGGDGDAEKKDATEGPKTEKTPKLEFDDHPSVTLLSHEEVAKMSQQKKEAQDAAAAAEQMPPLPAEGEAAAAAPSPDALPPPPSSADAKPVDGGDEAAAPVGEGEESAEQGTEIVKEVPVDRVRWMYETSEEGWKVYSPEASRELEEASREGKTEHNLTLGKEVHKCKLDTKKQTRDDGGGEFRMRRHILGEGLKGMWEILTMKYEKPSSLFGQGALKMLEKVWQRAEDMSGKICGLGFLFLYGLFTGESRVKISGGGDSGGGGGGYSSYFMYGGRSSKGGGSASSNDSHRFALLMTQLFIDKHTKSLPASVINVLGRNRQVCLRLPKFKDSRKAQQTPHFNGWVDEVEPRSPLADLFSKVVPMMSAMKRKGAFHFPPPPPHAELPSPATEGYLLPGMIRKFDRPELSDYSCDQRLLSALNPQSLIDMISSVQCRLGTDKALRPQAPIHIEDTAHFETIVNSDTERLFVVDFHATWCGPCKSLAPVYKLIALRTPTATFLKVDVDECDDLTARFDIKSMPTIVFLRGSPHPAAKTAVVEGGGATFFENFATALKESSTEKELIALERYESFAPGENIVDVIHNMLSTDHEINTLTFLPLGSCCEFLDSLSRTELGMKPVNPELAFDVTKHDAAQTQPAKMVLERFRDDVGAFATSANTAKVDKALNLSDKDINNYFFGKGKLAIAAKAKLTQALASVKSLIKKLQKMRDLDAEMVKDTIPLLEKATNFVTLSRDKSINDASESKDSSSAESDPKKGEKIQFLLNRMAGQNAFVWVEFLFGMLLSSCGERDLLKLNPYITPETMEAVTHLITIVMLRANRLGHANRCIGTAISLESLLSKALKVTDDDKVEKGKVMTPKLIQVGEDLAKTINMARYYVKVDEVKKEYSFDPRYLVFEFVWNIQLRKKQVDIVDDFRKNLAMGKSKVKQMIMGAGKTSVVAPLLALIVADGKSLVLSVVPKALVEMSRTRMRETFAAIMVKRIYTLEFDRSTTVTSAMRRSLENAASNRGVVVATPTTLKSIMLSYVEHLQQLKEAEASGGMFTKVAELKSQSAELAKILALFKDGIMLLDEVDLILHPLKSELNFPIGDKFDLDGSEDGERWGLPIHLFDALFFAATGRVSTFEQRGVALEILKKIAAAIQLGIRERHLQRLPHVTLLNIEFYEEALKPLMAEWAYLWLQKNHLHGIDRNEAVRYMLEGAAARSENSTKISLLEMEEKRIRQQTGEASPDPDASSPPSGAAMSASDLQEAEVQLQQLAAAKEVAHDHDMRVNEIYKIDEQIDEKSKSNTAKLAELQGKIIALHKQIGELECPRDDSLDNSIVVWYSQAFALNLGASSMGAADSSSEGDSSSGTTASVPALCSAIEDLGLTVQRCSDPEEAISKARDLQSEGMLRCIIVGGDERGVSCGKSCVRPHIGEACLRCGGDFEAHNGHDCPFGGRGSFSLLKKSTNATKMTSHQIMTTLTDAETPYARAKAALPSERTAVYTAHVKMKEEERMKFWKMGSTVTDDSKQLLTWVNSIVGWDSKEEEEEEETAAAVDPLARPQLERQTSQVEKMELIKLRNELEELEDEKIAVSDEDENSRRYLLQQVSEQQNKLEEMVMKRIEELEKVEKEFCGLLAVHGVDTTSTSSSSGKSSSSSSEGVDSSSSSNHGEEERVRIMTDTHLTDAKHMNSILAAAKAAGFVGAHSGRDAALAIAWLSCNRLHISAGAEVTDEVKLIICKHCRNVQFELVFLKRMALAAKVVAHVTSPMHKKLLNLCHNWLSTFLPHCLAKVNRVSFGLLSADDCKAALEVDPHVPRSRLKLGVPFVGKDVPSRSSEFAHPDVIIGLTVLAYRYSGLRKDDFIDLVDALTAQFSQEIGPARDRESSLRHESWVHAAAGAIRGLKGTRDGKQWQVSALDSAEQQAEKEVVQLKFLQKSNKEQMDKLYELIRFEPTVIHYYLQRSIFPQYMRSQRMKISASGQAVGGDMLVNKRVGFSGTPSDLLPRELGRCDYETGDDGMMLTTCLDRSVTSYEFIQDHWTVELLLDRIANADSPRYHALIDTGALITGYSNKEVAEQLLERGLSWCEGVVFLDDDDKQQVLVRATGRVVSADQCGVSLERRFAFYDQIHTTGMDIKHVVNATAVITLGKDMVFRDYVQGAYRMRGIGMGQRVHVFVIPEVKQLMGRELADAVIPAGSNPDPDVVNDHVLEDVVAWLILNSLRSEQTQWTMLCVQNVGNLYRKTAFRKLMESSKYLDSKGNGAIKTIADAAAEEASQISTSDAAAATAATAGDSATSDDKVKEGRAESLAVFDESIDFSLEAGVPDSVPFEQKLRNLIEDNKKFIEPDELSAGAEIISMVGQFSMIEGSANRLDTEQEREQEQEQEKEVEARRDQQIEVEKFVDREFSRQEEVQRPWAFSTLAQQVPAASLDSSNVDNLSAEHPFYRLKDFKLRHHEPLEFPDTLLVSSNYFNPNWTGLRRVKNVVMVLEFAPSASPTALKLCDDDPSKLPPSMQQHLSNAQQLALQKAHSLLGFHAAAAGKPNYLTRKDLKLAIAAFTDQLPTEEQLDMYLAAYCSNNSESDGTVGEFLSAEDFTALLMSGKLHPRHEGRYWVALSLAEAETIRRIMHIRMRKDPEHVIPKRDTELALRYSPMATPPSLSLSLSSLVNTAVAAATAVVAAQSAGDGGVIFDASRKWNTAARGSGSTVYEGGVAHSCFRFFDCDMHFSLPALNLLIRSLKGSVRDRERFFHSTIGCRRRMERKWQETPLAKVFTVADEWVALKQQAQAIYITEALHARNLTLWEAFTAFDYDNNGVLAPSEFYGALRWLNVPDLTAEDVVDFIEAADKNRDGMVDYAEYMDFLSPYEQKQQAVEADTAAAVSPSSSAVAVVESEEEVAERQQQQKERAPIPKVEPYGAEELREIMVKRRQREQQLIREERQRKQLYQEALDVKVFEEELEASRLRKGGANPSVRPVAADLTALSVLPAVAAGEEAVITAATALAEDTTSLTTTTALLVTDFRFSTNQAPLRFNASGKSNFVPVLFGTAADPPPKAMTCDRRHTLLAFRYYWMDCSRCQKRTTSWACWPCYKFFCATCYEGDKRAKELDRRDPSKHPTFLRCQNACSFTLQIPSAGGPCKSSDCFTLTMEVRFERLPPRGQLQSLLRFSLPDMANARKLHRTSVYLNGDGFVVGKPIERGGSVVEEAVNLSDTKKAGAMLEAKAEEVSAAAASAAEEVKSTAATVAAATDANSVAESKADGTEVIATATAEATAAAAANAEAKAVAVKAKAERLLKIPQPGAAVPRIRVNRWAVVSISVEPSLGRMSVFIDGKLSHVSEGLDPADLKLQHKLVVLGGGKQAHVRGGDIHRLCIHNAALTAAQVSQIYCAVGNQNPANGGRIVRIQAVYRGYRRRELNRRLRLDVGQYCKSKGVQKWFTEGDKITADWKLLGGWYSGVVAAVNEMEDGSRTYKVEYDDGDVEDGVSGDALRSVVAATPAADDDAAAAEEKDGEEDEDEDDESSSGSDEDEDGEEEEEEED